ncbi:MAG: hypothetical protein JST28_10000 [Acidobacteria bacterium]|nr:hypothetical protein [Acidobacteriota bacterium]
MSLEVRIAGLLKDHARGRRLIDLLDAGTMSIPDNAAGISLFFGNEFQKLDKEAQSEWMNWSQKPGRAFLLLPPYQPGFLTPLLDWELLSVGSFVDSLASPLARRLSGEVRHQLKGSLQVPSSPSGFWDNGTVNTCFYRRHPHAGLFAATCLPLWSLSLLDAKSELKGWLEQLLSLAGKASQQELEPQVSTTELKPEHFTLLLHLCSQEFRSDDEALNAIAKSELFEVPSMLSRRFMTDLANYGLSKNGRLTEAGRAALANSSFEPFAAELEARVS